MAPKQRDAIASHPLAASFLLGAGVASAAYLGATLAISALRMGPRRSAMTLRELRDVKAQLSGLQTTVTRLEGLAEAIGRKQEQRGMLPASQAGTSAVLTDPITSPSISTLPAATARKAITATDIHPSNSGSTPTPSPPVNIPRDPLFFTPLPVVPSKPLPMSPVPSLPNHTPASKPTPPAPKREPKSLFAWQGLRAGASRMGPMPIVDVSNPNYITFAQAEQRTHPGSGSAREEL